MAVITNFGVPTDSATGTTLMPKLQYRFRVSFTNLGGGTLKDQTTQNVISASRPNLTHEEVIVDSYNSKMYLAGKHTWEPVTIVLRDDMDSNVIKINASIYFPKLKIVSKIIILKFLSKVTTRFRR